MMSDYVAFKIDLLQVALRKNSLDDLQFVRVNYYGAGLRPTGELSQTCSSTVGEVIEAVN